MTPTQVRDVAQPLPLGDEAEPFTGGEAADGLRPLRPMLGLEPPLDFFRRDSLQLMPQEPLMAERIAQSALSLAMALIGRLPQHGGARIARPGGEGVHIIDVQVKRCPGPAECLRAANAVLGVLVDEHDHSGAQLQFGVRDTPARVGQAQELLGPEDAGVELDGGSGVAHAEIGKDVADAWQAVSSILGHRTPYSVGRAMRVFSHRSLRCWAVVSSIRCATVQT